MAQQAGSSSRSGDPIQRRAARRDPFGETADPALYVARPATTQVLDALVRRAEAEGRPSALTGPPGIGKTTLLHRIAERVRDWLPSVYLPYAALPPAELAAWILGIAGEPAAPEPETALLGLCRRLQLEQSGLVLLIDDAGSMPLPTARALCKHLEESEGALRMVLVATDDARASRVIAALGPEVEHLRLTTPMNASELRHYVRTRLERAGIPPEIRERFDDSALSWIHRLSGGVPRRVHDVAASLLDPASDAVSAAWWEERWLGAPIEDLSSQAVESALEGAGGPELDLPEVLVEADPLPGPGAGPAGVDSGTRSR